MRWVLCLFLVGCTRNAVQSGAQDLAMPSGDLPRSPDLASTSSGDLATSMMNGGDGLIASRPYNFHFPNGLDASKPAPLLVSLHGFGSDSTQQDVYWRLTQLSDDKKFLYAHPDGTLNPGGQRYWNASDACCDFYGSGVNDVAYLNAIIDDVSAHYQVDPDRIYVVGHSNGGFMSHRMACDAPRVAAIVSLAGAAWKDATRCKPAGRVSVLEVHGDADPLINYNGGGGFFGGGPYPSARDSVGMWAQKNGCSGALAASGTLDLERNLGGAETTVEKYAGCPAGGAVELWTIKGAGHVPVFQDSWGPTFWEFLNSHPKP